MGYSVYGHSVVFTNGSSLGVDAKNLSYVGSNAYVYGGRDIETRFFNELYPFDVNYYSPTTNYSSTYGAPFADPVKKDTELWGGTYFHTACLYNETLMIVFGGIRPTLESFDNAVYTYNIHTGEKVVYSFAWNDDAPWGRYYHSAVIWKDRMYIYGGYSSVLPYYTHSDMWYFSLTSHTWTKVDYDSATPWPRLAHTAMTHGDSMLVYGGVLSTIFSGTITNDVYSFDFESRQWKLLDVSGPYRFKHAIGAKKDGGFLLVGGARSSADEDSALWLYTLSQGTIDGWWYLTLVALVILVLIEFVVLMTILCLPCICVVGAGGVSLFSLGLFYVHWRRKRNAERARLAEMEQLEAELTRIDRETYGGDRLEEIGRLNAQVIRETALCIENLSKLPFIVLVDCEAQRFSRRMLPPNLVTLNLTVDDRELERRVGYGMTLEDARDEDQASHPPRL
jgi:hypothetical protein